ncbi:protein-ADP-ribose hydrolase [Actinomyces capricornis]|uniref:Macro domain-containing protein n=1 Tax=Actinomyces capricornis TaxID=2755559 RepID=A0ABN6K1Q9_9ACTO|nr:protein-ADP-ribose hydrolase [Actinomyces capricornis]BDA63539.1 hypothetical protein MANAM107_03730 [Actinomyces capricornis]
MEPETKDSLVRSMLDWFQQDSPQAWAALSGWPRRTPDERRRLLRGLMNLRGPAPVPIGVADDQDRLLRAEISERGLIEAMSLAPLASDQRLALWRGDITRLRADAIVNAANAQLLGCFMPLHHCIDNAIHSAAGMGLRAECARIMAERGRPEPTGTATLTQGHCLAARHIVHTVGPIVRGAPTPEQCRQLASCYASCLAAAAGAGARSIAVCCISTGEYGFPQQEAARVALTALRAELGNHPTIERVVLNVFTGTDQAIYRSLLGPDA